MRRNSIALLVYFKMSAMIDECLDCLASTVQMNLDFKEARSSPHYSLKLDDDGLADFADTLMMDVEELETRAKPTIRKILNAIHDHSGCAIDRFCVSGSIGHQSENASDLMGFDITVFVDCGASHGQTEMHGEGHTECVIHSAERIQNSFRHIVSTCHGDHFGVHFELDNYQFHLAVTPSLSHKMHLQRKAVWDLIEKRDKENKLSQNDLDRFSIALHESLTSFMHMGDPVFHGLVRLARLWRENTLIQQGCGELSTLGAVLVMYRCIEDEKARGMSVSSPTGRGLTQHPFPVKKVFNDFLTSLTDIQNFTLSFQRFYEPDLIPERHLANKPYVLDPVNPWRNVVHNMTSEGMDSVRNHAMKSVKIMSSDESTMDDLFMCQQVKHRGGKHSIRYSIYDYCFYHYNCWICNTVNISIMKAYPCMIEDSLCGIYSNNYNHVAFNLNFVHTKPYLYTT